MRGKKGFLLLEIMVSIVIITGGLLFIMQVFSSVKKSLQMSKELFSYSLLLEEKMFDFEEKGSMKEGMFSGRFTDLNDYLWQADVRPVSDEDRDLVDLNIVEIGVSSEKKSPENQYLLFTYLAMEK